MNEIRTTKIDGQEFVTLTDYLRLKEEKEKMQEEIKILKQSIMQDEWGIIPKLEEENKNLKEREEELRIYITGLDQKLGRYKNTISDLEDELDVKTREIMRMKKRREKTDGNYNF